MIRARTTEEYIRLIEEAIYETEELRVAAEYDMESMGGVAGFVDQLEASMRELYNSMKEGSYRFADKDLPYMELLNKQNDRSLPFKHLLNVINTTHRKGLDVDE
ncbi:MAG TPA: general secretion pathway protein GspF [Gammaproteobacteria bacterium]|nr:general secretion pathway protein GspF [Gammaproteobacteria bacterium]